MFKNIFTKTIYEKRGFIIGWSLGLIFMAGITVAFFPTIKNQIGTLFANVPKSLESITGSTEDYKNIIGYVGTGVFDLRMPMLTIVMAIILALGLSVGEESSGRLYQLLAQPISRARIVLEKWFAMLAIFAFVHLALLIGIMAVIALIHESMPLHQLLAGTVMCFLLTAAIGSLTLLLSFGFGRKGMTTLGITAYSFGSYLLTSFAAQVDWLKYVEPVSIFHYYKASEVIKHGYNLSHLIAVIAITLVSILIATLLFNRRDIGLQHG